MGPIEGIPVCLPNTLFGKKCGTPGVSPFYDANHSVALGSLDLCLQSKRTVEHEPEVRAEKTDRDEIAIEESFKLG